MEETEHPIGLFVNVMILEQDVKIKRRVGVVKVKFRDWIDLNKHWECVMIE